MGKCTLTDTPFGKKITYISSVKNLKYCHNEMKSDFSALIGYQSVCKFKLYIYMDFKCVEL